MSRAIPLLPLWVFVACSRENVTFTWIPVRRFGSSLDNNYRAGLIIDLGGGGGRDRLPLPLSTNSVRTYTMFVSEY
jgi:hypothetical protein